jgi:hypothetical protein
LNQGTIFWNHFFKASSVQEFDNRDAGILIGRIHERMLAENILENFRHFVQQASGTTAAPQKRKSKIYGICLSIFLKTERHLGFPPTRYTNFSLHSMMKRSLTGSGKSFQSMPKVLSKTHWTA